MIDDWKELQKEFENSETIANFYRVINDNLLLGNFLFVNFLFSSLDPDRMKTEFSIGILTITNVWKNCLRNREDFFKRTEEVFKKRYNSEEKLKGLLGGLE